MSIPDIRCFGLDLISSSADENDPQQAAASTTIATTAHALLAATISSLAGVVPQLVQWREKGERSNTERERKREGERWLVKAIGLVLPSISLLLC